MDISKKDQYTVEISEDVESNSIRNGSNFDPNSGLKRGLKTRHITLMALGGIIGPGAVAGVGVYLNADGPASLVIDYALIGSIAFALMQSIGELNSLYPATNGFSNHMTRFVDEAFAAAASYNYVILWITCLTSEYLALCATMQFWGPQVPIWGYFLIFWAFFMAVQFLGVSGYGEAEYWLAIIKLVGLTAFYIFVLVYMCGGVHGHKAFGFHNFETPFANQSALKSLANALVATSGGYVGIELLSLNAAETKNPIKAIPIAIRQTVIRILYIFVFLSMAYGIAVPYDSPQFGSSTNAIRSPIYVALYNAGWHGSKHLVNAFILIVSLSSINSAIYIGTRTMVNMANEEMLPFSKYFRLVNKNGVPWVSAVVFHLTGFIALLSIGSGSAVAYTYFSSLTCVSTFLVWFSISFTQIRFRQGWTKSGRKVSDLPYQALWHPILPLYSVIMNIFLALIQGWMYFKPFDYKWFIDCYILFPLSFIFFFGYKWWKKTKWVKFEDMDFETGRRLDLEEELKILKAEKEDDEGKTLKERLKMVLREWI